MSKNIEINILNSDNNYEALYPQTLMSNITGNLDASRVNNLPKNTCIVQGSYKATGTVPMTVSFTPISGLTPTALIIAVASDAWVTLKETSTKNFHMYHTVLFTKTTNHSNVSGLGSDNTANGYIWAIKSLNSNNFVLDEGNKTLLDGSYSTYLTINNYVYNYVIFFT